MAILPPGLSTLAISAIAVSGRGQWCRTMLPITASTDESSLEIASVGPREKEAIEKYGGDKVLIGFHKYEDTAKGEAMNVKDYFVKVIVEADSQRILGAHIVGPQVSVLIHEINPLMHTQDGSLRPIRDMTHIHPALSEVVDRAFQSLYLPNATTTKRTTHTSSSRPKSCVKHRTSRESRPRRPRRPVLSIYQHAVRAP